MTVSPLVTVHLTRLTTDLGLFEHADGDQPRPEHGFCVDDVARALVVVVREPDRTPHLDRLLGVYLDFVLAAQSVSGAFRNRRDIDGTWTDAPTTDDHWGRALWALGTVVSTSTDPTARRRALAGARLGFLRRSPWPRSTAYAALGAAEVLRAVPQHAPAAALLADARRVIGGAKDDPAWPWPEPRLTYANAVLAEALLARAGWLHDDGALEESLVLLRWLVGQQVFEDHLSPVPTGGRDPGGSGREFDQQPIEVAALAEAASRAWELTRDQAWLDVLDLAARWVLGENDAGLALYDPRTGAGYDGLHADAVNLNQGAESTLAVLSTLQLARQAVAG